MTTPERRENAFTEKDRRLLKAVDKKVTTINGEVMRNKEELFGDEDHGTVGLVSQVAKLMEFRTQVRAGIAVILALDVILLFRV